MRERDERERAKESEKPTSEEHSHACNTQGVYIHMHVFIQAQCAPPVIGALQARLKRLYMG